MQEIFDAIALHRIDTRNRSPTHGLEELPRNNIEAFARIHLSIRSYQRKNGCCVARIIRHRRLKKPSPTRRGKQNMYLSDKVERGETTSFPREVIEAALAHGIKDKAEATYARVTCSTSGAC